MAYDLYFSFYLADVVFDDVDGLLFVAGFYDKGAQGLLGRCQLFLHLADVVLGGWGGTE